MVVTMLLTYYRLSNYYGNGVLREKCPYSELFWSAFFRIRIEYGVTQMRENTDQNNSE